ncbi:hypothetical protein BT63DRAFT_131833 [Microthyrium microscopicum]|uniref:Uncharacterized protein n=1 Tax=Microthyrium microscopicum TaxID=703497 RepID=A0A6A6UNY0_9PEZI|nr:hypothetical protein BT63DRAFT_131833 [Microthyrium microscopicum]
MLCKGNYIEKKGFIKGARGMLAHANKSHKVDTYGGRKLDSQNILEFCTHRDLNDGDVEAILSGQEPLDIIPVRDAQAVDQQFTASTPKVTKVAAAGITNGHEPTDSDLPYDWLLKYPTVVLRKDGTWVELRCDICGGNSLANSDRRFAQGVIGFVRHLSRGHGIKPERASAGSSSGRLEWAIARCTYREVPAEEVAAITENADGAPSPPPKIPFKQTAEIPSRLSNVSNGDVVPTKRPRAVKRTSEAIDYGDEVEEDEEEEDSEVELDMGADSDFDPSGEKRARLSISNASPKATLRKKQRLNIVQSQPPPQPQSVPASPIDAAPGASSAGPLDKFCSCSINGHECTVDDCVKLQVCRKNIHDETCRKSGVSHETKPSCVNSLLGVDCPDGDQCNLGHDFVDERRTLYQTHSCMTH